VLEPRFHTVAATAAPIPEAMSAYSIAVAPYSSLPSRLRRTAKLKLRADLLDMRCSCSASANRYNNVVKWAISGSSAGGIG
jgi:hypothetical protein